MNQFSIEKSTFTFLRNLSKNNNRDWFNAHKGQYLLAKENAEHFVDTLINAMNKHDHIETPSGKKSLYRIYNDVRFSKDQSPYSARFSGYLRRSKPLLRGGYYFWIKPGDSRIGCGFAHPNPDDLKHIRMDIMHNYGEWRRILRSKAIVSNFGAMEGDKVKTAPQGFPKEHPAIDLLRYKQYWFSHRFSDQEVLSRSFVKTVSKTFKAIRPFFDYMSEVLSTDLNGEPILPLRNGIQF